MSRLERLQFQRCCIVRGCLRSPGMEHVLFNTESTWPREIEVILVFALVVLEISSNTRTSNLLFNNSWLICIGKNPTIGFKILKRWLFKASPSLTHPSDDGVRADLLNQYWTSEKGRSVVVHSTYFTLLLNETMADTQQPAIQIHRISCNIMFVYLSFSFILLVYFLFSIFSRKLLISFLKSKYSSFLVPRRDQHLAICGQSGTGVKKI